MIKKKVPTLSQYNLSGKGLNSWTGGSGKQTMFYLSQKALKHLQ